MDWYNAKRLWTGKDPVTGDKANRLLAFGGLALDVAGYVLPITKLGKLSKGGKVAATAATTIDVDDVSDTSRAFKAADAVDDAGDANRAITSLDKLSPKDIQSMSLDDIRRSVPTDKGWTIHEHNGRVHIYDGSSPHPIIRIDPPDTVTKYDHIHFYDKSNNPLDINGDIVSRKSPDAHIPWLGK